MSAEAGGEAPVEPSDGPPRLDRRATVAALALLGLLAAFLFWPAPALETLDRPEESLTRLVTRELDLRAALETAPGWERRLVALALASDAETRAAAIEWYEELVREEGSPRAELYRIVLLAEDGQEEAVLAALAAWTPTDPETARLAAWARAAYGRAPPPPRELGPLVQAVRRELPAGWFADRLVARLAGRLDDPAARAAEQAIRARGTELLWRLRAILAVEAALLVLGALALAGFARPPGLRALRLGAAAIPPRWTAAEGVGLFARGAVGLVGVAFLWPFLPDSAWSSLLITALSAAPLVGYLLWYCRRAGVSVTETLGLQVSRAHLPRLAAVTVALVAVATAADAALDFAGSHFGLGPHWTDGFQEALVWGPWGEVAVDVLDSCLVAPVVEELLFRGVLYGTFRLWLGPWPAALWSAGLFALAHGYGAVGFASVLTSGLLWAAAYERTRSLLPGILAHAANNVQATAIVLATLRL